MDLMNENKYHIDYENLQAETESEYNYEEVPSEFDIPERDTETDLAATVRILQEAADDDAAITERLNEVRPVLISCPPSIDDFVRSFLLKMGMQRTLDCFQSEFFELKQKNLLNEEDLSEVPDIYSRNQQLDDQVKLLRHERDKYKAASLKAREMYIKLRNERDFHKINHRRVAQEKNKLLEEIKILKRHYSEYEPALNALRKKYEVAMKEKMLSRLERDRAVGQVVGLQSTLKSLEQLRAGSASKHSSGRQQPHTPQIYGVGQDLEDEKGVSAKQMIAEKIKQNAQKDIVNIPADYQRHPKDKNFPKDSGVNPALANGRGAPTHLTRSGGLKLANTWQAHEAAVSYAVLHPGGKPELVTTSDDQTWKLWNLPDGDCVFTGEGHSDWLSCADYHPNGTQLATASGDATIKLWDFAAGDCIHTFGDHTGPIWSVQYHWTGDFLASCSIDNTIRLFDFGSIRCRMVLRGHANSVNSVQWLPHGNLLISGSADKTIQLWDPRVGISVKTFYGHLHSLNFATLNAKGDMIAGVDSFGFLKLFDVRNGAPFVTLDLGPHAANHCAFDPTSNCLAVASNEGVVKMVEVVSTFNVTQLSGHEDSVQACVFDHQGEFLITTSSDQTVRIWN